MLLFLLYVAGIFVRVFESRIEFAQILILGPSGGPYADIPFLFDLYLPADYPNVPPLCHYRSFGEKLNPNLFKDGRVCCTYPLFTN